MVKMPFCAPVTHFSFSGANLRGGHFKFHHGWLEIQFMWRASERGGEEREKENFWELSWISLLEDSDHFSRCLVKSGCFLLQVPSAVLQKIGLPANFSEKSIKSWERKNYERKIVEKSSCLWQTKKITTWPTRHQLDPRKKSSNFVWRLSVRDWSSTQKNPSRFVFRSLPSLERLISIANGVVLRRKKKRRTAPKVEEVEPARTLFFPEKKSDKLLVSVKEQRKIKINRQFSF